MCACTSVVRRPQCHRVVAGSGWSDRKREIRIPVAYPLLFKSDDDRAYETEAQPGLNHRKLYWPRGKMLGGTSSINGMIYIRGNRHDYDQWQELGNRGWAFDDVLPYFKKAQHQTRGASEYHGIGGPLNVADLRYVNPLTALFIRGAVEAGFAPNHDFNGESQEGVGLFQVTQKRGERHSTAAAYLKPALHRRNLTVHTQAHVTRVVLQGTRAVAVEYQHGGRTVQVTATREIVLCGGTVNTPQLLMLSGLGPAEHLKSVGIPVIVDLPGVGRNLQDHLLASAIYECTKPLSLINANKPGNYLWYVLRRKGPLASNIGEAGLFTKSSTHLSRPDLQLIFAPNYSMSHGFGNPPGHGFTLGVCQLRPQSRGQITLHSKDPFEPPAIQPNYLTNADDLQVLVVGVRIARRIAATDAFDPVRGAEVWPGAAAEATRKSSNLSAQLRKPSITRWVRARWDKIR